VERFDEVGGERLVGVVELDLLRQGLEVALGLLGDAVLLAVLGGLLGRRVVGQRALEVAGADALLRGDEGVRHRLGRGVALEHLHALVVALGIAGAPVLGPRAGLRLLLPLPLLALLPLLTLLAFAVVALLLALLLRLLLAFGRVACWPWFCWPSAPLPCPWRLF
jgi:hypothetical protein